MVGVDLVGLLEKFADQRQVGHYEPGGGLRVDAIRQEPVDEPVVELQIRLKVRTSENGAP